jgi:hypothetical protein
MSSNVNTPADVYGQLQLSSKNIMVRDLLLHLQHGSKNGSNAMERNGTLWNLTVGEGLNISALSNYVELYGTERLYLLNRSSGFASRRGRLLFTSC